MLSLLVKMMIGSMVGSYKVTDMIGEGGMGAVFRGIDVMLEREVAIKVLRPELSRQPDLVERFRSEAVTLAKLNHQNIATLYSFLRQGDDFFMVMEFVRGETLDSCLRRTGAMPVQYATQLFCHSLEGIEHAHQMGVVHRDIKPANMMITPNGSIKVMDFGIARMLGASRMTRAGHLVGTIEYMSPEQVRGEETDARSDIYSLGMLLYEMLTGLLPFAGKSEYDLMRAQIEEAPRPPTQLAPHIPLAIEQAIMRALAKRPEARIQTAAQFRLALQQAVGGVKADESAQTPHRTPPQTRLAPPGVMPSTPAFISPTSQAASQKINPTRLAPNQSQFSHHQQAANQAQQPAQAAPTMLSRLNWKHYSFIGALLAALVSLPIVIFSTIGTRKLAGPAAPAVAPIEAAPVSGSNAPTVDATPAPQISPERLAGDSGTPAGKQSSPQDNKRPQSAVQPARSERSAGVDQSHQPSSGSSTGETSTARDRRASGADDDTQKENKASRGGGATGAVGGAFRKLGGLFGKRKGEKRP